MPDLTQTVHTIDITTTSFLVSRISMCDEAFYLNYHTLYLSNFDHSFYLHCHKEKKFPQFVAFFQKFTNRSDDWWGIEACTEWQKRIDCNTDTQTSVVPARAWTKTSVADEIREIKNLLIISSVKICLLVFAFLVSICSQTSNLWLCTISIHKYQQINYMQL